MNHTASSLLASSFLIASGTSSPSFVDTRSGEGGAGVDGSHGLACLSCLPSRFWCAHRARHTAMIQQPPAMHAIIIPAISPRERGGARTSCRESLLLTLRSAFGCRRMSSRCSLSLFQEITVRVMSRRVDGVLRWTRTRRKSSHRPSYTDACAVQLTSQKLV